METNTQHESLDTLRDIRSIMERSARFLSLSGWSGIWAGTCALAGGGIALVFLEDYYVAYNTDGGFDGSAFEQLRNRLFVLGLLIFLFALSGAFLFTYKKVRSQGLPLWNKAAQNFLFHLGLPLVAGAGLVSGFLFYNDWQYVAPACLIFYGLGLVNAAKYTLSDIRYLGILEIALGICCTFMPSSGLYFWLAGFGLLHIIYGIVMWRKYDKRRLS